MHIPLQIHFRDMPVSPSLETLIREKAAKLEQFHPNLTGCRVVIDKPHQHSQQGDQFSVTVDVSVPGATIVANHARHADANIATRDAFIAARRQVEDHVKRQRLVPRQTAQRQPDGENVPGAGGIEAAEPADSEVSDLDALSELPELAEPPEAAEPPEPPGAPEAPGTPRL